MMITWDEVDAKLEIREPGSTSVRDLQDFSALWEYRAEFVRDLLQSSKAELPSTLIDALINLVKASEDMLDVVDLDGSRGEIWSDELDALEARCNYARGVLLAAGHPVEP